MTTAGPVTEMVTRNDLYSGPVLITEGAESCISAKYDRLFLLSFIGWANGKKWSSIDRFSKVPFSVRNDLRRRRNRYSVEEPSTLGMAAGDAGQSGEMDE